jgi:predicted oxidoreductase
MAQALKQINTQVPEHVHARIVKIAAANKSTVRNVIRIAVVEGLRHFDPAKLEMDGRRERTA